MVINRDLFSFHFLNIFSEARLFDFYLSHILMRIRRSKNKLQLRQFIKFE